MRQQTLIKGKHRNHCYITQVIAVHENKANFLTSHNNNNSNNNDYNNN